MTPMLVKGISLKQPGQKPAMTPPATPPATPPFGASHVGVGGGVGWGGGLGRPRSPITHLESPATPPATPVHTDHPLPATPADSFSPALTAAGAALIPPSLPIPQDAKIPLPTDAPPGQYGSNDHAGLAETSEAFGIGGEEKGEGVFDRSSPIPNNHAGLAETSPTVRRAAAQAGEGRRGPLVDPVHPSKPLVDASEEPPPAYGEEEPELTTEEVKPELTNGEGGSPPAYDEIGPLPAHAPMESPPAYESMELLSANAPLGSPPAYAPAEHVSMESLLASEPPPAYHAQRQPDEFTLAIGSTPLSHLDKDHLDSKSPLTSQEKGSSPDLNPRFPGHFPVAPITVNMVFTRGGKATSGDHPSASTTAPIPTVAARESGELEESDLMEIDTPLNSKGLTNVMGDLTLDGETPHLAATSSTDSDEVKRIKAAINAVLGDDNLCTVLIDDQDRRFNIQGILHDEKCTDASRAEYIDSLTKMDQLGMLVFAFDTDQRTNVWPHLSDGTKDAYDMNGGIAPPTQKSLTEEQMDELRRRLRSIEKRVSPDKSLPDENAMSSTPSEQAIKLQAAIDAERGDHAISAIMGNRYGQAYREKDENPRYYVFQYIQR